MESMVICYERERLIELLQRDALKLGTFTLASGRLSHYYIDGRKLTLSAEGAALIGAGVLEPASAGVRGRFNRRVDAGGRPDRRRDARARVWRRLGPTDGIPGSEGGERPRNGKSGRGTAPAGFPGGDRRRRGDDGWLVASGR